jgi:hypothetical protein
MRRMRVTLAQISTICGLIGLIASVLLLTWQTRAVAQQTKISNALAGASVLETSTADLREVLLLFVDRPELRAYFYDSKSPPAEANERARVTAVAEMLGDLLETGLVTNRIVPSTESFADWVEYSRQMLTLGPILRQVTDQHPEWWPRLAELRVAAEQSHGTSPDPSLISVPDPSP